MPAMENLTLYNELNELNSILDSNTFKICHGIASFLAQVIAFFGYLGIIHYEFIGGDPMKR